MFLRVIKSIGTFAVMIGFSTADSERLIVPIAALVLGAGLLWIAYRLELREEAKK